jgi:hypothetical protein
MTDAGYCPAISVAQGKMSLPKIDRIGTSLTSAMGGQKRKSSPALLHVRCCSESGRCRIKWKTSAKGPLADIM